MSPFFDQFPGNQSHGGISELEAERQRFRLEQASGIIEVQTNPSTQLIVVLARGVLAGAYILKGEKSMPIVLNEVLQNWDDTPIAIRSLTMPDNAARLVWQMLDAQPIMSLEIQDEERWQDWLVACQDEQISALVKICSEQCHGLLYVSVGQIVQVESVYLLNGQFQTGQPPPTVRPPWNLRLYEPNHQAQAWQCLHLRLGAGKWLQYALNSYQEMVGARLTRLVENAMKQAIDSWDLEINEHDKSILDKHFFPTASLVADAYRAPLMSLGEHIDVVLGHRLTQRLLNQAFERIHPTERGVLESQRLIPAALFG